MSWKNKYQCAKKVGSESPEKNKYQRAKKVVSNSRGLVDFAIRLVDSVFNWPDGQVKFFEEFTLQKYCQINMLIKTFLGLVQMLFWPVNVSFGLPEWQAVEITFFAPWIWINFQINVKLILVFQILILNQFCCSYSGQMVATHHGGREAFPSALVW